MHKYRCNSQPSGRGRADLCLHKDQPVSVLMGLAPVYEQRCGVAALSTLVRLCEWRVLNCYEYIYFLLYFFKNLMSYPAKKQYNGRVACKFVPLIKGADQKYITSGGSYGLRKRIIENAL